MDKALQTIVIGDEDLNSDYVVYLKGLKSKFELRGKRNVNVTLEYVTYMSHTSDEPVGKVFDSKSAKIISNAGKTFDILTDEIVTKPETCISNGSGWSFSHSYSLKVKVSKYRPFAGGKNVKLPQELVLKRSLINMKSDDDFCFKWCVTRHFNRVESHSDRVSATLKKSLKSSIGVVWNFQLKLTRLESLRSLMG